MVPCPNDPLALIVLDVLHVLVFQVRPLPNFHFAPASDDPHSHGGEEVVGGVGVHVDATVEHGGGVLADARVDHRFPSGMRRNEVGDVVDHPRDRHESSAVLGLIREVIPFHDGKSMQGNPPIQFGAFLVEFLLHLLDLALFDFVLPKLLQVIGQAQLLPDPD